MEAARMAFSISGSISLSRSVSSEDIAAKFSQELSSFKAAKLMQYSKELQSYEELLKAESETKLQKASQDLITSAATRQENTVAKYNQALAKYKAEANKSLAANIQVFASEVNDAVNTKQQTLTESFREKLNGLIAQCVNDKTMSEASLSQFEFDGNELLNCVESDFSTDMPL